MPPRGRSNRLSTDTGEVQDVVHVVDTAAGTLVQAHVMNSTTWTDVAVLDNIHGVSATNLYASHSLIL